MSITSHPINCRPGQAHGERRKEATLDLVVALGEQFSAVGRRALLLCSTANGTANAHHVWQHMELPPSIALRCRFSALSRQVVKTGVVECARYIATCRPTADAGPMTIWPNGVPAKPEAWLRHHPDVAADRQKVSWPTKCDSMNITNPSVSIFWRTQSNPNQLDSQHDDS